MDLKSTQLKDTYGNLLTIGTVAGSPTSGILQNGDGDNIIELAIRVDTTTASVITDDLVSVADEKDMAQGNGGGIKFGGIFSTGGSPNTDMTFIKASKSNATSGNFSYDMVLGTRANGQTPLERMRLRDNGDISFRDTSANEAFYWDASAGSLGIGTTSPNGVLEVNTSSVGSIGDGIALRNASNQTHYWNLSDATTSRFQIGSASGEFAWQNSNGELMRIDSSGNVGIGTSSPQASSNYGVVQLNGSTGGVVKFSDDDTLVSQIYGNDTSVSVQAEGARSVTLRTNGSEAMRIDSSGNVLVGTTARTDVSTSYDSNFCLGNFSETGANNGVVIDNTDVEYAYRTSTTSTSGRIHLDFYNPNGRVGSIQTSASATAYNTSSDYRLKENVVPMEGALDKVAQLKPSTFNFIADADTDIDGFIAHEVQEIVPNAVSGEKDAVDEEGKPMYQGIDHSKLVPILVGAIQELKAEIEQLKAQ